MLLNLSKKTWTEGLLLQNFTNHTASNEKVGRALSGGMLAAAADAAGECWRQHC